MTLLLDDDSQLRGELEMFLREKNRSLKILFRNEAWRIGPAAENITELQKRYTQQFLPRVVHPDDRAIPHSFTVIDKRMYKFSNGDEEKPGAIAAINNRGTAAEHLSEQFEILFARGRDLCL